MGMLQQQIRSNSLAADELPLGSCPVTCSQQTTPAPRPSLRLKLETEERGLGNSLRIGTLRHRKVGPIHLSS